MAQLHQEDDDKGRRKLVVFWEGTGNPLEPVTTQIGIFAVRCRAKAVYSASDVNSRIRGPLKVSFDGCGVTHGNWGLLFACGLDEQAQVVVQIVEKMLQHDKRGVHVVAVGLSRGGMACMKLARLLAARFTRDQVTASMLLFDPVPGNALLTGFPWTACFAYDLSQCHNLVRVLALYPYEALPAIAMHAPTLCKYNHETTLVQEDVTMGCHQGALFLTSPSPSGACDLPSNLSMRRILDYLECEGIRCDIPTSIYVPTPESCIKWMERTRKHKAPRKTLVRQTHDCTQHRNILRHSAKENDCRWLNRHHEQLARAVAARGSTSTIEAVYGNDKKASGSYQLDFDEGYSYCPC